MIYTAKFAVCSEIRIKHSTQREHDVEFLNVNLVVSKESARLSKVKQFSPDLSYLILLRFLCG
jgi:hypothetical protein